MPQVTLYLDEETDRLARAAAAAAGLSYSKWLGRLVLTHARDQWPDAVRDLAGAIREFPTTDELYRAEPPDAPREALE